MKSQLEALVADLHDAPVECDGMARLVTTRLVEAGVAHEVLQGELVTPAGSIPFHFWVLAGEWVIDLRARMWLGERTDVPHGVIEEDGHPWTYYGRQIEMAPLSASLFELLCTPIPIRPLTGERD